MGRLNERPRSEAIGMLRAGSTIINAARHFNCSRDTLYQLQRRYQQTGSVSDRPRSGRPRALTARQVANVVTSHRRNRRKTAVSTARVTRGNHG